MRTKNSIRNSTITTISVLITIIAGFIAQKIFIDNLGLEYLGLNGLFDNLISVLSIIELGIGPAIIYSLYKPVAQNNTEKIKSLLLFYKKAYRVMFISIILLSIIISLFLPSITGNPNIKESIYLIFFLFVTDSALSYLLTYKRSLLYAYQENYIIELIHIGYTILINIIQILILIYTKNYLLYIILEIILKTVENIIINTIITKKYPFIKEKNIKKLDKETLVNIKTKVKGLIFHKIGGFVVFGTDNILISYFIGLTYVGLYSNYILIINSASKLNYHMFTSIIGSVGNLVATSTKEKIYNTYKLINLGNLYVSIITTVCFATCLQPFMKLWIGQDYLLGYSIVITLCINYYLNVMRNGISIFKEASGIFYEDRFVPLIESIVNLVISIICLHFFGLIGVFIGTISSNLVLYFYSHPTFIYEKVFKRKKIEYIFLFLKQFIIMSIILLINILVISNITINNTIIQIIINLILSIIITNILIYLTYRKTKEYKYFINLILKRKSIIN